MSKNKVPLVSPSFLVVEFLNKVLPGVPVISFSLHFELNKVAVLKADIQLQEEDLKELDSIFKKHGVTGKPEDVLDLSKAVELQEDAKDV